MLIAEGTKLQDLAKESDSIRDYSIAELRFYFDATVSEDLFYGIVDDLKPIDLTSLVRQDLGILTFQFRNIPGTFNILSTRNSLYSSVGWQLFA